MTQWTCQRYGSLCFDYEMLEIQYSSCYPRLLFGRTCPIACKNSPIILCTRALPRGQDICLYASLCTQLASQPRLATGSCCELVVTLYRKGECAQVDQIVLLANLL